MAILVTGGAGFIGSNFILEWLALKEEMVINLDQLTYAGNLKNLHSVRQDHRYAFAHGNIGDRRLVQRLLTQYRPRAILNFAAESHVDRSIKSPESFIQTNVVGTFHLLECAHAYWNELESKEKDAFRFLHISTDEIYGSLGSQDTPSTEDSPCAPNSPYAASKAASNHLVRVYHQTYGLPTLTTNCSNNYGPYQFPEKLIPLMIHRALKGEPLPLYGDGKNVRDWLYVSDHCSALARVLEAGKVGDVYNIAAGNEKQNIEIVQRICKLLDDMRPNSAGSYTRLITYVKDRLGHDHRYAIDTTKIQRELNWTPLETLETGLIKTIQWYLDNQDWVAEIVNGDYQDWVTTQYGARS